MQAPQGTFELKRLPQRRRELLRAWDGADLYLLKAVAETVETGPQTRLLIVNDAFGALAVPLADLRPQAWSDSYLSQQATLKNLAANNIPAEWVSLVPSTETPEGPFDLVLIKVPKTLALLEDELIRLRPQLAPGARVIAAGMAKHLPATAREMLGRLIGPTTSSLTWKKARLLVAEPDPTLPLPANPYPQTYPLEGTDWVLTSHANVFSRDHLDIGTRLLLKHLPRREQARDIIDLGCGNGVIGLVAAELNPQAKLYFVDESFQAVASAQANFQRIFGEGRSAEFRVGDRLEGFAAGTADLVLCNPPFHQQASIGGHIASSMFAQSREVLRSGGELWVVGNRHLDYHKSLKRLFGNVRVVASNAKFVLLQALR